MGVTRKMLSVSSLGMIDFRSAKDKTVRNTRKQLKLQRKMARSLKLQEGEAIVFGTGVE